MHLLVIITRQEDKACDFLNLLPTVGVRGATVIEGRGMGKILRERETIFTSIEQVLSASIDLMDNVVILSLVQGGEVLASVRKLARQVFGTLPVRTRGFYSCCRSQTPKVLRQGRT